MKTRRGAFSALCLAGLLIAACGSDSKSGTAATSAGGKSAASMPYSPSNQVTLAWVGPTTGTGRCGGSAAPASATAVQASTMPPARRRTDKGTGRGLMAAPFSFWREL